MGALAFEYNGGDTFLSRMNPAFKLLYLIIYSILLTTATFIELYLLTLFLIIIGVRAKVNLIKLFFKLPIMVFIALFISLTEYLNTRSISVTIEETITFITLLLSAILFMTTTDITELASSLAHYLSPIVGKRAWSFSSSIMITLAILPMIFTSSSIMLQARKARGDSFFSHPVKNLSEYTISLMSILFKKSVIFEDALLSRSYISTARRRAKCATRYDIITLLCLVLITIMILLLRRG